MADLGRTATGEATMATLANVPPQPKPVQVEPTYHTPHGYLTLAAIKDALTKKILNLSHLGDDALKALGEIKSDVAPVVGGAAWGTAPAPQAPQAPQGGAAWGTTTTKK